MKYSSNNKSIHKGQKIKTFELFRTENNHLLDQTIEFKIAEQAALVTSLNDVSCMIISSNNVLNKM